MANPLNISLKISLDDAQANAALRNFSGNMSNFAKNLGTMFGAQAIGQMKKSTLEAANFRRELTRISQTSESGLGSVAVMNRAIFSAARKTGENVENILGGYQALAASGLSIGEIVGTMDAVSIAMATTGTNADNLAAALAVASQNFGFDLSDVEESTKILDMMYVAGKRGNAELENLSSIFSRAGASAKMAGMNFGQSLAVIEQLSLTERNPERLATLFDSMTRLWTNNTYLQNAQRATGVKFFDEDGARRDMFSVMGDLQGQYEKLQTEQQKNDWIYKAFGKTDLDTRKAMSILLGSKGGIANTQKIYEDIVKASGQLRNDFDDATDNMVSQLGRAGANIKEAFMGTGSILDKALTPVLKVFNDSLDKGNNREIFNQQVGLGLAGLAGIGILGQFGAFKGALGKNTFLGKASSGAQGIFAGKMYEQMAGVTPVYVVNMPQGGFGSGGLPGGNPPLGPTGPMPASTNWKTPIGKMPKGGLIGMALMALTEGWQIGQSINYGANAITEGRWENMTFGLERVVGGIMDLFDENRRNAKKTAAEADENLWETSPIKYWEKLQKEERARFGDAYVDYRREQMGLPKISNNIDVHVTVDNDGNLIDQKTLEARNFLFNPFAVVN